MTGKLSSSWCGMACGEQRRLGIVWWLTGEPDRRRELDDQLKSLKNS